VVIFLEGFRRKKEGGNPGLERPGSHLLPSKQKCIPL
jgi:hypothetical protein